MSQFGLSAMGGLFSWTEGIVTWMEGLNISKLGGWASNTLLTPVRILVFSITAAAIGIFILVQSTFPAGLSTFGLQIAPEKCPHPNMVAGVRHDVCGMGEDELAVALALPHGTRQGTDRFFYSGAWHTFEDFNAVARKVEEHKVVCVVIHVEGQMPCVDSPGGCVLHFHLRPRNTDLNVLNQLIERVEMAGLDPHGKYETILDAGGNCGIASVLFATQYPEARIVSVEPARGTFDMLRMNTEQFPNVMTIHAGVWSKQSTLVLFGNMRESWGMQVKEVNESEQMPPNTITTLDGISIPYILHLAGLDHFDFLKVDIEGSELQVFDKTDEKNDLSYLNKVQVVVCEIHEWMRPGASGSVMNAFSSGFDKTWTGEYVMFTRQKG